MFNLYKKHFLNSKLFNNNNISLHDWELEWEPIDYNKKKIIKINSNDINKKNSIINNISLIDVYKLLNIEKPNLLI
jgi:hypothetical protein